jgi:hypothetical protein
MNRDLVAGRMSAVSAYKWTPQKTIERHVRLSDASWLGLSCRLADPANRITSSCW